MDKPRPPRYGRPYWRAQRAALARDGFVCQLCGGPIDKTLPANHPMGATVDHIQPISRGGAPKTLPTSEHHIGHVTAAEASGYDDGSSHDPKHADGDDPPPPPQKGGRPTERQRVPANRGTRISPRNGGTTEIERNMQ